MTKKLSLSATAVMLLSGLHNAKADWQTYPQIILSDKPVAYYRLEEQHGATVAVDATTNKLNGSITVEGEGTNTFPKMNLAGIDHSFQFRQMDDASTENGDISVTLGTMVAGTSNTWNSILNPTKRGGYFGMSFSAECWVRPTTHPKSGEFKVPVSNFGKYSQIPGNSYTNASGWNFYQAGETNGGSYWVWVMKPVVWGTVEKTPITKNQWYHLVGTFDGTKSVFYINGEEQRTDPAKGYVANEGSADLHIGTGAATGQLPWDGGVDEVALYTYPLSAAQVAAHYQSGTNSLHAATAPQAQK